MLLTVINPNTTASMTEKIGAAAGAAAAPGTIVVAINPAMGPVSIEGYYDEAFCVPGMLERIREARDSDAFVIACFDDTGLDAARSIAAVPVIGICEAAMHVTTLIAGSFSVVTTLGRSIPVIEHLARKYGFAHHCRKVRAAEVPVLDLEDPGSGARGKLEAEIARAVAEDRPEAIILGCAGMADLARDLSRQFGLPVVDGVAAAVKLAEGLVGLGLRTSKSGGYAAPRPKPYTGSFAGFAP
ncbi:MAG: aspartate/glutamate racemase family protein [Geminicoccaceae bacterium]